jgi:hypothetical protein
MVSYLAMSDRVREVAGETVDRFRDVFEEARVEYADTLAPGAPPRAEHDALRRSA